MKPPPKTTKATEAAFVLQEHGSNARATSGAVPTVAQLASLAATLSKDTRIEKSPKSLAADALDIWNAALQLLHKTPPPIKPPPPSLPEPKRYPVTLDEFLRLVLPNRQGKRGAEYPVFRKYIAYRLRNRLPPDCMWAWDNVPDNPVPFDCLNPQIVPGTFEEYSAEKPEPAKPPEPTQEEEYRYFDLWKKKPIPNRYSFAYHASKFLDWYPKHISEERSSSGSTGGLATKDKREKEREAKRRKEKLEAQEKKVEKKALPRP